MEGYNIQRADNGWLVLWEESDDAGGTIKHIQVFEVPYDFDDNKEAPQALIDLLYFIKDDVCGQYYSKHKDKNVVIRFDDDENEYN